MTESELNHIYQYMKDTEWLKAGSKLDSNRAYECVQEMEKQGHADEFELYYYNMWLEVEGSLQCEMVWSMNPTNFFSCMSSWLESSRGRG
jgi:hypothetical protein